MATTSSSAGAYRTTSQRPAFINVFMIVGEGDSPIFFSDLSSEGLRDDSPHLDEFIIHSALDSVDAVLVCPRNPSFP